jgi:hypothetical protein
MRHGGSTKCKPKSDAGSELTTHFSNQTVGNILKRQGLCAAAPERKRNTSWGAFIRRHKDVLWSTDFFTTEV